MKNTVGSPPLTRGIPVISSKSSPAIRFTPAHAGNTKIFRRDILLFKVHPRSRGEYTSIQEERKQEAGSPPLTRGIQRKKLRRMAGLGFTPAHAGNTFTAYARNPIRKVHPRSRGEYDDVIVGAHVKSGSPPLTRGIHGTQGAILKCDRFTPAHAGNTLR